MQDLHKENKRSDETLRGEGAFRHGQDLVSRGRSGVFYAKNGEQVVCEPVSVSSWVVHPCSDPFKRHHDDSSGVYRYVDAGCRGKRP